jgi:AcrR family transcriptional regulator
VSGAADSTVAGRKGRPRDERIDSEITATALALLAEVGFVHFSIAEVVHRTGVAKTTIYRRFATREQLIGAALDRLNDHLPKDPPPGEFREQLVATVDSLLHRSTDSLDGRVFTHAMSEASQEPAIAQLVHDRVLAPRRALLRRIIAHGLAAGQLRTDIDPEVALPIIVGPALYISKWQLTDRPVAVTAEQLVDIILGGMGRTPANGS